MTDEELKQLVASQEKMVSELDRYDALFDRMGGALIMMKGFLLALRADRKIPGVDQMLEVLSRTIQFHGAAPDAPSKPDERGKL